MDKLTSTLRFQVWTERVRECHTSGMTVMAWCEQNIINQKTYYYWQRKVRKQNYALKVNGGQPPAGAHHHNSLTSLRYPLIRLPAPVIFIRISSCAQPMSQ